MGVEDRPSEVMGDARQPDERAKKAAALGPPGLLRLRALHKKRVSQAQVGAFLMLAVQKAYHARLQEVAPRKGDPPGVRAVHPRLLGSGGMEAADFTGPALTPAKVVYRGVALRWLLRSHGVDMGESPEIFGRRSS